MVFINHNEVLQNTAAIVSIDGSLESETSPDLEEYINQLLYKNILFIMLDARSLTFISSAGFGVILFLQKRIAEKNGFFVIFNLNTEVQTLFNLLGFDKVFRIAHDRADAIQIMDRQLELHEKGNYVEMNADIIPELSLNENEGKSVISPPGETEGFRNPIIIECISCKSLIRVKERGEYQCPDCKTEFSVARDMSVSF